MAKRELRIQRELMHFDKETSFPGMTLAPDPNDIHHFTATILGPDSSPYHRGVFHIDITLTDDYPFMPPKMRFTTKIWHPNISSQTGAIGLDILKNNWSPAINLRSALICLQALLSVPEPTEPQDAVVAKQYLTDRAAFTATARRWTEDFALVSSAEYNRKVEDFAIVSSAEYNRKVEDVAMVSSAEYNRKVEEFVMISSAENSRKVQKLIDKSGFRNTLLVIAVYLLLLGIGSLFV